MRIQRILFVLILLGWTSLGFGQDRPFLAGADISMLPTLEQNGAVYRQDGQPGDALKILRDHGCNLFRVRLFVHPTNDYASSWGAVQDLSYVKGLARRVKAVGGVFLLDIHYSDTWADPGKQYIPAAWKDLDFEALRQKVHDYTASVLNELQADGELPDMVQVGNEITSGMMWPAGKVLNAPPDRRDEQWRRFGQLFHAGARAVREFSTPSHPVRIVLHISGGGRAGLPKWFFSKFNQDSADYDIIGLSFYPAWNDSITALKKNMNDLIESQHKDIFLAETSYPWHPLDGISGSVMQWPCTKAGQMQFLHDLISVLHAAPEGHGLGFCWWYPEAIPMRHMEIWRDGGEGLFDREGNVLPAMDLFAPGAG